MAGNEEEWEETVVLVELSGIVDQDWAANIGDKCKILGIDTDSPVMQLDRYIFTGEYKDAIGTCALFEETPDESHNEDSDEEPKAKLKYKYKTHKKLLMQRAFLVEKEEMASGSGLVEQRGETEPADMEQAEAPQTEAPADELTGLSVAEQTACEPGETKDTEMPENG